MIVEETSAIISALLKESVGDEYSYLIHGDQFKKINKYIGTESKALEAFFCGAVAALTTAPFVTVVTTDSDAPHCPLKVPVPSIAGLWFCLFWTSIKSSVLS